MTLERAAAAGTGVQRTLGLRSGSRAVLVALVCATLAVVVLLLASIAIVAFREAEGATSQGFTLSNFVAIYGDSFAYKSFANTLGFAITTVVTALLIGTPMAWLAVRTNLPGRVAIFPIMTLGLVVPTFFTAMGWMFLLHPRMGMVNRWLVETFSLDHAPINIGSVWGMGWVQGLSLAALAFVMMAGSFQAMDPSIEESAQIHGLGLFNRLRKVTFPVLWPSILAAGIYVFTLALGAFDVPAIIGLGNRVYTFSTFVFTEAQPEDVLPNYGIIGAASAFMVAVALPLTAWYLRVIRQADRYAVVTGRNYRPEPVNLGRWWMAGWAFVALVTMLTLVLPVLMLVWAAFTPYFQPFSWQALENLTLLNFRQIGWAGFWNAANNTLILVLTVPTITAALSLAISWVVVRSGLRAAPAFDVLAFLPHVVPNIVFAVGAIIVALFWIRNIVPIYGTIYILMGTYIATRISFATRVYNGALVQLHRELDEAGYVFGLGSLGVIWYLIRPLLTPTLLYSWLWMALLTYRELTMAALLATSKNITLPVFIFEVWRNVSVNGAAAVSLVLVLMISPLVILYFIFGRKRLAWSQ